MTPEIVTLCHSALVQGDSMSILGAFGQIAVERFPSPFPPFVLACRLRFDEGEAGEHRLKLTVVDRDGRVLGQMMVGLNLPTELFRPTARVSITFPISGMDLVHSGEHAIDLVLDDGEPIRTPFDVVQRTNP